jgi:cytochrome c oxidase subunit IV
VTRAARLARAAPYALLLALAGWLYFLAGRIDYVGPPDRIGPGFWPRAILVLLALVCTWEIARGLIWSAAGSARGVLQSLMEAAAKGEPAAGPVAEASPGRLAAGVGVTLAYVLLVDTLGFFVATAGFLFGFIAVGGYRRWGVALACAAAGSLAMVIVFMKLVYVSLPLGTGPFRSLSLALIALLGVR